jgi:outer membrane protein assembly factor BamB
MRIFSPQPTSHSRTALIAFALAAALLGLGACSGKTKSKDNVAIPNELSEIKATTSFVKVWASSIKSDDAMRGEHLGPAISGERVFLAGLGEVRAVSLTTGKTIWSKRSEYRFAGGPSTDGKRVLVGTLDGDVLAFDAADGEALWSAEVTSEVLAAPTFAGDLGIICSNDGRITALDLSTGKRSWQVDRDVPLLSLRGGASAMVDGDTLYVPSDSGKVFALNLADGAIKWEQAVNISNGRNELERIADIDGGSVLASGDLFVAGYNGQTSAVAAGSGSTLWTYQGPSVVGLTVDERRVYLTNNQSEVVALDRRSGAEIWKQSALLNRFLTKPAVAGDKVVVGDLEGYLHALDLETGAIVGRTKLDSQPFPSAPVVANDVIVAQSASGGVAAYRLR